MSPKTLLAAFLAVAAFAATPASAAVTVAERSPFAQGFWWDSTRAGSGFEMFNAAGTVMVTWYTYDANRRAVWYTAQGGVESLGTDWPLLRHSWANGSKAPAVTVGRLKLTLTSPESASLAWTFDEATAGRGSGTQAITPFFQSGIVNEVDRSGTWFDPANPGWGLSLLEQGDVTGGALFTYDPQGQPTWLAGFERTPGSVEIFASVGACPACAYIPASLTSAGRLGFDIASETRLTLRTGGLRLAMAAGVNVDGASLTQLSRPASTRGADRQLAAFDAATLRSFLDNGLLNLPASPIFDFSPAPAATPFSPTNLVEAGVDEAGLAKSNGRQVFGFAYDPFGSFRQPRIRVANVAANGASASLAGEVPIGGESPPVGNAGLVVYGDKLVSVTGNSASTTGPWGWMPSVAWSGGVAQVEIFDASGALPSSRWRAEFDGFVIATRRIGKTLYVVTRFTPSLAGFAYGITYPVAVEANRRILATTSLDAMLPKVRVAGQPAAPLLDIASILAPPLGSRKPLADLIVVTPIDLEAERLGPSIAIAGSVEAVYASPENLYLATTRQELRDRSGNFLPDPYGNPYRTDIHQVALDAAGLRVVGTGSLEGYLDTSADRAPFRLSEHQAKLRVVTTSLQWSGDNVNRVTVMEPSRIAPGLLKVLATLPNANRPERLGKARESLYATRFAGDRLYAVTFRMVDPLYVVDLSNPADPKIAGALELPGFSEYLHPLGNGLLLGFGKDAVPAFDFGDGAQGAWFQGLKVALFDVSDAGRPRTLDSRVVGKRGSESALLRNHQALSLLPLAAGRLAFALPARVHDTPPAGCCAASTAYAWTWSGLLEFELQGSTPQDAKLAQRPPLQTHSPADTSPGVLDAATDTARSVLFPAGTVYVGNGKFWHRDAAGQVKGGF